MVPSNMLQRTYRIRFNDSAGTAFTVDIDSRQYLITAKHVVEGIKDEDIIYIFQKGEWKEISCSLVGFGDDGIDIAVLSLPLQISPLHPLLLTSAKAFVSQDIYLLGFPYEYDSYEEEKMNNGFPFPLVKKGIISKFLFGQNGLEHLVIDGHNNPGFSGGPVFYSIAEEQNVFAVAGIISGYQWEPYKIFDKDGNETDLTYQYNTGIIFAPSSLKALEIIQKNPIGFLIK